MRHQTTRPNWQQVFEAGQHRKPRRCHCRDGVDNFIEMRDKTASPVFRTRKKIEHTLHRLFPQWFMPLYNMISFSTIPMRGKRAGNVQTNCAGIALSWRWGVVVAAL
jgi:hypothetical protein